MKTYTIEEAKKMTADSIRVYLKKDEAGNYFMREVNRLPFYWVGAPGIGKTEAARQIAKELGIGFVSLSITHHSRTTVLGLPTIESFEDSGQKYTEYTTSEILAAVEEQVQQGWKEGILLIDEFASMAESLVPPMLAFLQTKNIGQHTLPQGWVLILCSNPREYNHTVRSFDMAIMDRVRFMKLGFSAREFLSYGEKQGFHPAILEFLGLYPVNIHICQKNDSGSDSVVTPRGWENLSWAITGLEAMESAVTQDLIQQFIKDEKTSFAFWQFYESRREGMKKDWVMDILAGHNTEQVKTFYRGKPYQEKYKLVQMLCQKLKEQGEQYGISEETNHLIEEKLHKTENTPTLNSREEERRELILEIGEQAGRVCTFLEEAGFEETLREIFIFQMQKSEGFVNCMLVAENRTYLDNLRRVNGIKKGV